MSFSKEMGQLEGLIGQAHQYISNKEHRWRQGRNARGANAAKVPTVNEARKF